MCKRGKTAQAYMMFEEVHERGIRVNNLTLASCIYGLLVRGRVREAYRIWKRLRNQMSVCTMG